MAMTMSARGNPGRSVGARPAGSPGRSRTRSYGEGPGTAGNERVRIAHDLHDGVIQSLYAVGMMLGSASEPVRDLQAKRALSDGVALINALIGEVRAYITTLEAGKRPATATLEREFAVAVRRVIPHTLESAVSVQDGALEGLDAASAEDLVYLAREAASNAVRHSGATAIAVDVGQDERGISLTVRDNGLGVRHERAGSGLGTVTMRTRAERLGGELVVTGVPGSGTTVRVNCPTRRSGDE